MFVENKRRLQAPPKLYKLLSYVIFSVTKMTKNILIPLNDSVHEEWSKIKGETTWKEILKLGIEAKKKELKDETLKTEAKDDA